VFSNQAFKKLLLYKNGKDKEALNKRIFLEEEYVNYGPWAVEEQQDRSVNN